MAENNYSSEGLVVLAETDTFSLQYHPANDPLVALLDKQPNFYIIHKQTGRVEAAVESVVAALDILGIATENLIKVQSKENVKSPTMQ